MNMNSTTENNFDNNGLSNLSIGQLILRILLFLIGTLLSVKIIRVCRKEKDRVWMINVTRAVVAILLMIFAIIFETVMELIPDISDYTGVGICYVAAFLYNYLPMIVIFESLVVSILKYIFIVHHDKSRNFGEERIQKIFFWANILHWILPAIISAYLWDIEIIESLTTCFGIDDNIKESYLNSTTGELERMFMCKLYTMNSEDLGRQFIYYFMFTYVYVIFTFITDTIQQQVSWRDCSCASYIRPTVTKI